MRDLFIICHNDHLVSGSVVFLRKLLNREFNARLIPYDGGIRYIELLYKSFPQAVFILIQTDFLAPWLCAQGGKVVIMPMYDACANALPSYFRILDNGYLFSFSKELHEKCTRAGIVSYQLNYYPVTSESTNEEPKENRLFYWRRRPHSMLSERNIKDFFSPYVESFHIHDRPDAYSMARSTSIVPDDLTSTSDWFENRTDMTDLVESSKYYLAPRDSEGIGMAFLEAMSLGCIVFANRNSTHNQYIYHGRNGFLIDFESRDKALIQKQIKDAFNIIRSGAPIGENARRFIRNGVSTWQEQSEKLLGMVVALSEAKRHPGYSMTERLTGRLLVSVHYYYPIFYRLLTFFTAWIGSFSPRTGRKFNLVRSILRFLRRTKRILTGRKDELFFDD